MLRLSLCVVSCVSLLLSVGVIDFCFNVARRCVLLVVVVCCLLFVACVLLFVVCCVMSVACCLLLVSCCSLFVPVCL